MERDVSFITGRRVQHALERLGHDVHPLDIEDSTTGALMEISPDAAFICLHGPGGEDGTVQALLETLGIPYTGSGPLSSIRCMDKDYAKRALRAAGIQTPPFRTFLRRAMNEMGASAALDVAAEELGYPLVVKPAREGSSFGLSRVEGGDGLRHPGGDTVRGRLARRGDCAHRLRSSGLLRFRQGGHHLCRRHPLDTRRKDHSRLHRDIDLPPRGRDRGHHLRDARRDHPRGSAAYGGNSQAVMIPE